MRKPRIAVLTAGHLSTCPRMVKAADALAESGYEVEVVSTRSTDWATDLDRDLLARRKGLWRSRVIDYSRQGAGFRHLRSGVRRKLARGLASRMSSLPFPVASRAFARVHPELVAAALATRAGLFYGGTTGGIAATCEAAWRSGRPFGLDLEDYFSGEPPEGSLDQRLAERIERAVVPEASLLTTSSEAITEGYATRYGVAPETIHNTFPLPADPPDLREAGGGPLRLYWFSQTIGPGRGLEDAIEAVAFAGIDAELNLRGTPASGYEGALRALVREKAPRLELVVHPPGPPDEMIQLARGYEVGLSLEQSSSVNRSLCLTNKSLVYPLAGLALAMTDTPGHRPLLDELGDAAVVSAPGDPFSLAEGLRRLAQNRRELLRCRQASWEAARKRWHWEHPEERGRLLRLFSHTIARTNAT